MKNLSKNIFVLVLAMVVLISSTGIAQVSHICKRALSGVQKMNCGDQPLKNHDCCKKEAPSQGDKTFQDPGCCTNSVKFFVNKIQTTVNEQLQLENCSLVVFKLLFDTTFLISYNGNFHFIKAPENLPQLSEQFKFITIQSFLI